MGIFLLGQTLIFWSGVLAAISFAFLMFTCSFNLGCAAGICPNKARAKLYSIHKYAVFSSIITVGLHITLALLASVFHILL